MSWPTPDGEPPPNPNESTPGPTPPEPDAETARVPVPAPPLVPEAPPPPPSGIISASPVGLPGIGQSAADPSPRRCRLVRSRGRETCALQVDRGAGHRGRVRGLVAYAADGLLLGAINVAVNGLLGLYDVDRDEALALIVSVILIGVDFLYFVGLWTSGWQGDAGDAPAQAARPRRRDGRHAIDQRRPASLARPDRRDRDPRAGAGRRTVYRAGRAPVGPRPADLDEHAPASPGPARPMGQVGRGPARARWLRRRAGDVPRAGRSRRGRAALALYLLAADQIQEILSKIGDSI